MTTSTSGVAGEKCDQLGNIRPRKWIIASGREPDAVRTLWIFERRSTIRASDAKSSRFVRLNKGVRDYHGKRVFRSSIFRQCALVSAAVKIGAAFRLLRTTCNLSERRVWRARGEDKAEARMIGAPFRNPSESRHSNLRPHFVSSFHTLSRRK